MVELVDVRKDFPILEQTVNGKPLVYLDNAATSQKPRQVIEALVHFFQQDNANIHRGLHTLSARSTQAYEQVRTKVMDFIKAPSSKEVVFTRGTTESINLVAHGWGRKFLQAGDVVLLTEMEHHSNIVPWQLLAQEKQVVIRYIPVDSEGNLQLQNLDELLEDAKLVALTHISNVLGTINPVAEICQRAHEKGALVLVDGAQAMTHLPVSVQELGCDFYAFSGHKMCAPTAAGVLWAKAEILQEMNPFLGGGEMIEEVYWDHCTFAPIPHKFEAGTMNIAQVIGLGVAIDYLENIGLENIFAHGQELSQVAINCLEQVAGLTIFGKAKERVPTISFTVTDVHPHDLATIIDQEGIAIRAGHHCAQPLLRKFHLASTARASFSFYNTLEEVRRLVEGIVKAKEIFSHVP